MVATGAVDDGLPGVGDGSLEELLVVGIQAYVASASSRSGNGVSSAR